MEKAKSDASKYSSGYISIEQMKLNLADAEKNFSNTSVSEDKDYWSGVIDEYQRLLEDEDYLNGEYAQSIDLIMIEIAEGVALLNSILNITDNDKYLRDKYHFIDVLVVNTIYSLVCNFGKMIDNSKSSVSLLRYWEKNKQYLTNTYDEAILDSVTRNLTNIRTRDDSVWRYRNKVIAHNAKNKPFEFKRFDEDFRFLVQVWSALTRWCSIGITVPFRKNDFVYHGFEQFCDMKQIQQMKQLRSEYLDDITAVSKVDIDGTKNCKSIFLQLSVEITTTTSNS